MSNILITGANKGLGREAARRLRSSGHDVWIGARDPARGRETAEALDARYVALDVTDDGSVAQATEQIAAQTGGSLDVLINNAGIPGNFADIPWRPSAPTATPARSPTGTAPSAGECTPQISPGQLIPAFCSTTNAHAMRSSPVGRAVWRRSPWGARHGASARPTILRSASRRRSWSRGSSPGEAAKVALIGDHVPATAMISA